MGEEKENKKKILQITGNETEREGEEGEETGNG